MKKSAATVIIGGGVIGASIAYHLAMLGMRDIVIVDSGIAPGTGSTGKATGGFRAQFTTAINIRLSLLAREKLLRFADETGVDPGYSQVGYLWLAATEPQLAALATARKIQQSEGLHETRDVAPDEIHALNPAISIEGIVGAAFCHSDGYIRPLEILRGYLAAAERLGVNVMWSTGCRELRSDSNGRIATVETSGGPIAADTVVNAAGPWARSIAAMAGVSLPVVPLKRQAAFTERCTAISPRMPMTIFLDSGFHIRARDGRALLCWPDPVEPGEPADLLTDEAWIRRVERMARQLVPALRDVAIDRPACYAGLYEMSPDQHAIVGRSPECANMYFANGSSGHGVMHAPALGEIVADLITGGKPAIDVSILRPSRFEEGAVIKSVELI
ncbi:MAG TPA: FAD-binding oxidoreductase [Gemmatimonadaceae bacterium]|nr:FAD-binding oxidoreductase [Gemmatimonadaceae bacterium]